MRMTWNQSQQQVRSDTVLGRAEGDTDEDQNNLQSVTMTGEVRHTGEDQNHLQIVTTTGEIRHSAW